MNPGGALTTSPIVLSSTGFGGAPPPRGPEVELRAIAVLLPGELIGDRERPLLGERPQVGGRRGPRRAEADGRLRTLGPRRGLAFEDGFRGALDRRGIGQEAILAEDGRRELLDDLLMGLAHVLDGEQPVGQTVLAAVRAGEAHVHELIGRAHHQEIRERELLIARDEDEPIRLRVQEQGVVVREREEAVGVGDQRLDGHEAQELVHVEIRGDLLAELLVVAPLDEADELDQALRLVGGRLGQGPVGAAVFLPVVAEEVEAAEPLRPHEQALVGVESILQERPVHGLDERVESQVRLLVLAGDGERHLGQGRARRGDSGLAEEGEGEGLARLRGVERPALELHGVQAVELRVIGAVQIDDEGTLQAPGGRHVGGIPRVADADAPERLALRRDGPARPGELDAEEVPLARSPTGLLRPRGRRRASRAAGRGRGLHGLVLVRRDLDLQRHDPGQTEEVRAGGLPPGVPVIRGPRQRR